jgi:hypothetical protein
MSLIVVHLRWDDVDPQQYGQLCRDLPDGPQRPAGCLFRQRRRQGRAVLETDVWADDLQAELFLAGLPDLLAPAGLEEPQRALFAVPAMFAAGYRVPPARVSPQPAGAPEVPSPRRPEEAPLPPAPAGVDRHPEPSA